jgi:hypothetical protein
MSWLAIVLVAPGLSRAETPPKPAAETAPSMASPLDHPNDGPGATAGCAASSGWGLRNDWACGEFDPLTERVWVDGEYLLWWFMHSPVPPLFGTVPASVVVANRGSLPRGSVTTVFGDQNVNYQALSGGRVTAGAWLNSCHTIGIDGGFFMLSRGSFNFSAQSSGDPVLGPLFADPARTRREDIIVPPFNGRRTALLPAHESVSASLGESLWGADINVRTRHCVFANSPLDFFVGFRYAALDGDLDSRSNMTTLGPSRVQPPKVPGESRVFPESFIALDHFGTRNRFYGGQIGSSLDLRDGPFSLTLIGKFAMGGIQEITQVNGSTTVINPTSATTFPGGILAEASNSGRHVHNQFSTLSELTVNLGYQVTRSLRAFVGYNLLILDEVVRPGDAVDIGVNPSFVHGLQVNNPNNILRPLPVFNDSTFWAQGINFGMEFRY